MELVRLPSLLPLLALFSAEECRVGVVRRLLEKLTTVEEVVEDKVTIGTANTSVSVMPTSIHMEVASDNENIRYYFRIYQKMLVL